MTPEPFASEPPRRRANYLVRHWRGELSLPVSFWINGFLSDIIVLVPSVIVRQVLQADYRPMLAAVAIPGLLFGMLAVSLWQSVGIWRSAGRRLRFGGGRGWAYAARLMVGLGVVLTGIELATHSGPELVEVIKIAQGDAAMGPHEVRLIRDGTELELVGTIKFGVTDEIRAVLDGAPKVRVIHLNSRGGRVGEARKLRDLIHFRGLDVYTSTECDSACTVAYIGGLNRYLSETGRLGFHQVAFPGLRAGELAAEDEKEKQALIALGAPSEFAEHAYATPSQSMWYPTAQELLAARIVTAIASSSRFAASGIAGTNTAEAVEAMMLRLPVYVAIRDSEPAMFAEIREKMVAGYRSSETDAELIAVARPYMNVLAKKYLAVASDEAVLEMTRVVVDEVDQVNARNPDACFALILPKPDVPAVDILPYVTRETAERDLAALTKVIESGAAHPQAKPDETGFAITMHMIAKTLQEQHGADVAVLGQLNTPTVDHGKACMMTSAMFKALLALTEPERTQAIRVLYARGAQR